MHDNVPLDLPFLEKAIPKMVYLHGPLCESVPYQHKHPVKPVILPEWAPFRPRMKVIVPLYVMGRMKSTCVCVGGGDCLEVKPERWISDRGRIRHE